MLEHLCIKQSSKKHDAQPQYVDPVWEIEVFSDNNQRFIIAEITNPPLLMRPSQPLWIGTKVSDGKRSYQNLLG